MFLRLTALALATATAAVTLTGCGNDDGGDGATGRTIVVGTEPTFPPFEFTDEQGNVVGFDIDLVKAIGERAGFDVRIEKMGFDALIPAVQSGQIDIAASGISITEERKQSVAFSEPYIEAGLVLAVRKDDTSIRGVDDLKGKAVAVQRGSTGAAKADELKAAGQVANVKYFATVPLAMMELAQGGVAAVINDKPVSEVFVAKQGDQIRLLDELLVSDSYGLAMAKGNTELVEQVNAAIREFKADGSLDRLLQQYFATAEEGQDTAAMENPAADQPQ